MKKFIISFFVFLCLSFSIITLKPAFAVNATYKQGIYNFEEINILPDKMYEVKNISRTDSVLILIFDKEYSPIQHIRLEPNSSYIDTLPMKPDYLFVVTGKGEVNIAEKQS